MIHEHIASDGTQRMALGAAMAVAGVGALIWPRCFGSLAGTFARPARFDSADRERVRRVIDAREQVEGLSSTPGRYLGIVGLLCAVLEAIPSLPPIFPYVLFCLAVALLSLVSYVQVSRSVERRAAPLVRRSPLTVLSPVVVAAVLCNFAITLVVVAASQQRGEALVVAIATVVFAGVAWRLAGAPALLVGTDPQLEYAVDERVRIGRARNVASLACAPVIILIAVAAPTLPPSYHLFAAVAPLLSIAAFLAAMFSFLLPMWRSPRAA